LAADQGVVYGVVKVSKSSDASRFDDQSPEKDDTPDDTTGWDSEF